MLGFGGELANCQLNIGVAQTRLKRYADAIQSLKRGRGLWERLVRDAPAVPDIQNGLAYSCLELRIAKTGNEQRADARQSFEQARALWEKLAREYPAIPSYRTNRDLAARNLAALQRGGA